LILGSDVEVKVGVKVGVSDGVFVNVGSAVFDATKVAVEEGE
jgi:hypothetical protein